MPFQFQSPVEADGPLNVLSTPSFKGAVVAARIAGAPIVVAASVAAPPTRTSRRVASEPRTRLVILSSLVAGPRLLSLILRITRTRSPARRLPTAPPRSKPAPPPARDGTALGARAAS